MIVFPGVPTAGERDACPEDCLPGEAAWVADIRLGTMLEDVQRTLGRAISRTVGYGEDDGGGYEETRLSYPGVEVYLVRGVVDRVVATTPTSCTANGICPGITKEQLRNRIANISERLITPDLRSFYICFEHCYNDFYLLVDYSTTGEVEKVKVVTDRP